jgi:hypothetical protein
MIALPLAHVYGQQTPLVRAPELITRGQFFLLESGDAWTAIECSDFMLLSRFQNGENIKPILAQRQACGFNLLRVWTLFDIPGIGSLTSLDYDKIPLFVNLCAAYGLYVDFTAYTGINDPTHWDRLCQAALQCKPRPILELVNELSENTNEPDAQGRIFNLSQFSRAPEPLLSAHGSNGSEKWPVAPNWSYATMHFNDAFEWHRKVGHNSWEIWGGPTLAGENTRFPDRCTSVNMAYDAAAGAALLCAGSCFHSVGGKQSLLWEGIELECATAWASGARSVPLMYQDGQYRHAIDLEGSSDLRVYQRVLSSGSTWTVHIRR